MSSEEMDETLKGDNDKDKEEEEPKEPKEPSEKSSEKDKPEEDPIPEKKQPTPERSAKSEGKVPEKVEGSAKPPPIKPPEGQATNKHAPPPPKLSKFKKPVHLFGKPKPKYPPGSVQAERQGQRPQQKPSGQATRPGTKQSSPGTGAQSPHTQSSQRRVLARNNEQVVVEEYEETPPGKFFNYIGLFIGLVLIMTMVATSLLVYNFSYDQTWTDFLRNNPRGSNAFRDKFGGERLYRTNGREIMSLACSVILCVLFIAHICFVFTDAYYSVASLSRDACLFLLELILLIISGALILGATRSNRDVYIQRSKTNKLFDKCLDDRPEIKPGDNKNMDLYHACQLEEVRVASGAILLLAALVVFILMVFIFVALCNDDEPEPVAYYDSANGVYVYPATYAYAPYPYYHPYYGYYGYGPHYAYSPVYPAAAGLGMGLMLGAGLHSDCCYY